MAKLRTKRQVSATALKGIQRSIERSMSPIGAYLRSHPELREFVAENSAYKVNEELLERSRLVLEDFNRAAELFFNAMRQDEPEMPALAVLARFDGRKLVSKSALPMTFAEVDIEDAGVSHLSRVLSRANASMPSGDKFDVICWFTGLYGFRAPVHVVTVDAAGAAQASISALGHSTCPPLPFFAKSLQIIRDEYSDYDGYDEVAAALLGDKPPSELRAAGQHIRTVSTYMEAVDHLEFLASRFALALREHADGLKRLQREHKDQMANVLSESKVRAREAAKEVKGELAKVQARLSRTAIDLAASQQREKALLKEVGREAPKEAPVAAPAPVSEQDYGSETSSHWRETTEHQAEVIRQLRVALAHTATPAQLEEEAASTPEVTPPRKLQDLARWAAENADRVIVLKRAINSAKKSDYQDDERAMKALDLLATTYREVKLGIRPRESLKEECDALGLDIGGSVSFPGAEGDAYYFHWEGRRRFLDQHIGHGNSRDPRFCFRTYFTWDDEEAKVIIGWTPTHLPTAAT